MAKNYPRSQTISIFIVSVIVVGAFAVMVKAKNSTGNINFGASNKPLSVKSESQPIIAGGIVDNWQEQFFGKDKNTLDIKQPQQNNPSAPKTETLTDKFGKDLFLQYWQIHQAGLENDQNTLNNVVSRFSDQVAAAAEPTTYLDADINISADTNSDAVLAYAKSLMNILSKIPTEDTATIANQALSNDDASILKKIDPIIKTYDTMVSGLKTIKVPLNMRTYHLAILNAISIMLFNAKSLRNVNTDPVKGLAAISLYVQGMQQFSNALGDIANAFTASGIIFTSSGATKI